MTGLEERIGYEFADPALLERALTTPACKMDTPGIEDNQRLEFLGDAVFGLLSAEAVFNAHPDEHEGPLTVRRTRLVSGSALAATAERIGLGAFLRRNAGAAPLPPRAKVLADAMEAIMGAVWLDGGLDAVRKVFGRLGLNGGSSDSFDEWNGNPKGKLLVLAQAMKPARQPVYTVDSVKGPSHSPTVTVTVAVEGLGSATATASSQRKAECAAATALLQAGT